MPGKEANKGRISDIMALLPKYVICVKRRGTALASAKQARPVK